MNNTKKHIDLETTTYVPIDETNCELKPENVKSNTWYLYFTVIITVAPSFTCGALLGWMSPVMIKLESNDTSINPLGRPITTKEVSLLFAVPGILALVGTTLLTKIGDMIGRKKTMIVYCFVVFLSVIGLAFSNNMFLMITFNICLSIVISGFYNIAPTYLTEVCENHNRAKYGCLLTGCVPVGELIAFILGPLFSYRDFTLLIAALLIPFLLLSFFVPESPVYMLMKGETKKCKKILKLLRNNKTVKELNQDFEELSEGLKLNREIEGASLVKLFKSKEGRIGVMMALMPSLVQIFCGVPIVMSLLAPIFNQSGSNLSGETIAIIVGVTKSVSFFVTSIIVERTGRRKLLITSSFGMGLAITILGIFFYLNFIKSVFVLQFRWIPLVGVLVYIVAYSIGVGSVPLVIIGEFFVSELRTTAFAFIITSCSLLFAVYSAAYPFTAQLIGIHWCMIIFGVACFIGGLLMYLFLPETKGKSISEIQSLLRSF